MTKYEQLAQELKTRIAQGVWQAGDKLPSLRQTVADSGLSLMTVLNAYQLLESQGVISAQAKSGYLVAPKPELIARQGEAFRYPERQKPIYLSDSVDINEFVFNVLQASKQADIVPFGSGFPDPSLFPQQALARSLVKVTRHMSPSFAADNLPPGNAGLRKAISQRYAKLGMSISPDEIIITSGAMEALNLSLATLTQAGDWVVIESPTFYGAMQAIERLKLRAIAVATDPQQGIDLEALAEVLNTYPVKACWLMSQHQNPLGCSLSDAKKQALYQLLNEHKVSLIEDDVYQELYVDSSAPRPVKAFDTEGRVLHCGSFSKSLIAGYRVGWVAAGCHAPQLQRLQVMSTLSTSAPMQLAIADFIQSAQYERHLKQLRKKLASRKLAMYQLLCAHLPESVGVNFAQGGYFLWLALPSHMDATQIYYQAIERGISIAPGNLFSNQVEFRHFMRLNASYECSPEIVSAVVVLAELIRNYSRRS